MISARDLDDLVQSGRRPTAKRLILSLLSQPNMSSLSLRQLGAWGDVLGQKPAAIRVTAGRLVKEDLLSKTSRGVYTIGADGRALRDQASTWITTLDQVRDWNGGRSGGWYCAHTGHLGKAIRRNVRGRQRALRLLGFRELVAGLWVRPDNLMHSAADMHKRLCQLGAEGGVVVSRAEELRQAGLVSPLTLWSGAELDAAYLRAIAVLEASEQRLQGQGLRAVTRESFVVGEHVIRQINTDPLLPADCVDTGARKAMVRAMMRYSQFCHPYWAEFLNRADMDSGFSSSL